MGRGIAANIVWVDVWFFGRMGGKGAVVGGFKRQQVRLASCLHVAPPAQHTRSLVALFMPKLRG